MQEGVEKGFPADDSVMGAEIEAEVVENVSEGVEEVVPLEENTALDSSEEVRSEGEDIAEDVQPGVEEVVTPPAAVTEEVREELVVTEEVVEGPSGSIESVELVEESLDLTVTDSIEDAQQLSDEPAVSETLVVVEETSVDTPLEGETIPPATRPGLADASEEPVTMADLLEEEEFHQPRRGDILSGVVISVGPEGILVDVGVKQEGIVPMADLERVEDEALKDIKVGDEIPVYVLRPRDRNGNLLLSISRAQAEVDWTRAQKLMESGEMWEGKVSAHNQGGLVIPFGKIRGFLPASQIVGIPRRLSEDAKNERLEALVNETLPLKVIEVDRRRRRLIFSHRAAWWEWKEMRREKLLEELQEGDIRKGVVSSLRDFGAFVDLGGADGLIHVSEITWHRVKHPSEVLKVGDEIDVYVLNVDRERKRIGLSTKRLTAEPWSTVEEKYHVDQLVEGVVTRVVDFGAFVKLDEGIEGLVHRSELADIAPQRTSDLVKEGDLLLLRIIRIEPERHRIGLSLRRVTEEEWSEWAAKFRQQEQTLIDTEAGEASDAEASAEVATESVETEAATGVEKEAPESPADAEVMEDSTPEADAEAAEDEMESVETEAVAEVGEEAPEMTETADTESDEVAPAPEESTVSAEAEPAEKSTDAPEAEEVAAQGVVVEKEDAPAAESGSDNA